jgi:glycerophosphoryl diester phosphodiesterase
MLGCDLIELDVRETADQVSVVIHDRSLARTTGRQGNVDALNAAVVTALDIGSVHVPLLADVAALICGRGIGLCLEFKDDDFLPTTEIAQQVVRTLRGLGLLDIAVANVSKAATAHAIKRLEPRVRVALDADPIIAEFSDSIRVAGAFAAGLADVVEHAHRAVTPETVMACRCLGIPLWAWTPNDPQDWQRLISIGVDAILTDDPEGLLTLLASQ